MLTDKFLSQLPIDSLQKVKEVSGGDINQTYLLETTAKDYFLKVQTNNTGAFFDHEVEGLHLICQAVRVPEVYTSGTIDQSGFLLLEWLELGDGSQADLGRAVAKMHRIHASEFGLDHSFDLGRLPKDNHWQKRWSDFFLNQRMDPLVKLAQKNGLWNQRLNILYEQFRPLVKTRLDELEIVPSLLHGDLWSGNYEFLKDGTPVLIDPDVFYGDREMDLAMTTLFGGFSVEFYQSYQAAYPLTAGWEDRLDWYRSYYLLAHLNLFGETYLRPLEQTMQHGILNK